MRHKIPGNFLMIVLWATVLLNPALNSGSPKTDDCVGAVRQCAADGASKPRVRIGVPIRAAKHDTDH